MWSRQVKDIEKEENKVGNSTDEERKKERKKGGEEDWF